MGIGFWLRRLFRRSSQGDPCNLCHCAIPASDLVKGIAVVIAKQKYCSACVLEITRRAEGRGPGWTFQADLGSSSTTYLR
jgi:hypothetical protein